MLNMANHFPLTVKNRPGGTAGPWAFSYYQIWPSLKKSGHPWCKEPTAEPKTVNRNQDHPLNYQYQCHMGFAIWHFRRQEVVLSPFILMEGMTRHKQYFQMVSLVKPWIKSSNLNQTNILWCKIHLLLSIHMMLITLPHKVEAWWFLNCLYGRCDFTH